MPSATGTAWTMSPVMVAMLASSSLSAKDNGG
jgi:hypothetical protein